MIGPILCAYGTPAQQRRFLQPILKGDEWWCQGYSEPDAGSDLAALRTRAVREGDLYRINGQKLWTSYAHWADWMFCLARTRVSERRQDGISFFLIDMKTPGITVKPIETIDLAHHTNEVFLDDVVVPASNLVGKEGEGWNYAKALLVHERVGIAELGRSRERLVRVKKILGDKTANGSFLKEDESFRQRVAMLEVELMAAEATTARLLDSKAPAALSSILKLRGSEISQEAARLNMDALGPQALRYDIDLAQRAPSSADPLPSFAIGRTAEYLFWRANTIAGGSSEVQRNILAAHIFGK